MMIKSAVAKITAYIMSAMAAIGFAIANSFSISAFSVTQTSPQTLEVRIEIFQRGRVMAGSIKWFPYLDDFGSTYAILADESNCEAVNPGVDYTGTPVLVDGLPRNVQARSAFYGTTDGLRVIKIPVLSPTIYAALNTATPTIEDPISDGITLVLLRIRPEIRRLPIAFDTGLQDGDTT